MTDVEDSSAGRFYPLSPKWLTTLFYVGLIVWAAALLSIAYGWSFQNKLFPVSFTALVIVLLTAKLVILHFPHVTARLIPDTPETGTGEGLMGDSDEDTGERTGREREVHEFIMIGWVVALPVLLTLVGFLYTLPIYAFAYIWYYRRDGRTAIVTSALVTAVVYGLFVVILGVRLPSGILFP